LKQVNLSVFTEKKNKNNELYEFNSRIESGNLGSVFQVLFINNQGWRILI